VAAGAVRRRLRGAAAIVTADDLSRWLAIAFGVVPAAAVGVPPSRSRRVMIVIVGAAIAVGLLTGSVSGHVPVIAVWGLFLAGLGAAWSIHLRRRIAGAPSIAT
jgi:hypothetical protein